ASFTEMNGFIYFAADDGVSGRELWRMDASGHGGATLVSDLFPGLAGSYPRDLTNVNGPLYFSTQDKIGITELWKSDGTDSGTTPVMEFDPTPQSFMLSSFTNVDGTLFFLAATPGSHMLWKSDGTTTGTVLVGTL